MSILYRQFIITSCTCMKWLKNIKTYSPKTKFKWFFSDYWWLRICSKLQFPKKNFLTKFFIKVHRFRLIHQKLNSKVSFRTLVETHLFKTQFLTKNFLAKFLIKMHRFRIIHQKLNSKDFYIFWRVNSPITHSLAEL